MPDEIEDDEDLQEEAADRRPLHDQQQAVPIAGLPEFEGRRPVGVVTKVNGSGERIHRSMALGEKVLLLVETTVSEVNHKQTKEGLKRHHTLVVDDLWETPEGEVSELLARCRQAYHDAERDRTGQLTIDDVEDQSVAVTVDAFGVAMTDAERAEAAGDVVELERRRAAKQPGAADDAVPPFLGYEDLTASDVVERLTATDDRALVLAIGDFEAGHRNRKTVLDACVRRGGELGGER